MAKKLLVHAKCSSNPTAGEGPAAKAGTDTATEPDG